MIDLNAEYEKFLDDEASELMDKITQEQVMEAVACAIDCDKEWSYITTGLRGNDRMRTATGLSVLVYGYWRKTLAEMHAFDIWWSERKADADADKAERNHDTYEMNNGSD